MARPIFRCRALFDAGQSLLPFLRQLNTYFLLAAAMEARLSLSFGLPPPGIRRRTCQRLAFAPDATHIVAILLSRQRL